MTKKILCDKVVLVTGGTGSLGKVLVRRLLSGELGTPKKIIILSRDEGKQHAMRLSYLHQQVATDEVIYNNFQRTLEFRIGNVRNYADICSAMREAHVVINAAALKHVPVCEYFPAQALKTNCLGAENIVRALSEHRFPVESVIGISTDKACKPVNVMGMTKALQERIFIGANVLVPEVRFVCVRYGNVLASRGSVIPLFHEQIKQGGPLTITEPGMTRFLLSLNQAVDTVFAALAEGKPGEIYVPNAPAATVLNIAKALVGKRVIAQKILGIRPGEKLHELLISEEEAVRSVRRDGYYVVLPMLPELKACFPKTPILNGALSSAHAILSEEATCELLARHNLLLSESMESDLIASPELLC